MIKVFAPLLTLLLAGPLTAGEQVSDPSDQKALSLTIYNRDLALIRDRREVLLPAGIQDLALRGVSARMQPETALLQAVDDGEPLRIIEQNFNYDLLTPAKLLEKYVGRSIGILRTNPATGEEKLETAKVLSTQSGLVVRIGDRIETNPGGRFIFRDIPPNLRDLPTLVTRLAIEQGGRRTLELSYLSTGLSWKADYVARLDREEKSLELAGWVTLTNQSGSDYRDARVQVVAGDVHRVSGMERATYRTKAMMAVANGELPREERLLDFHLYTLPRITTLLNRQTKQVALLSASGVPVRKEYLLQGNRFRYRSRDPNPHDRLPVSVRLKFVNDAASHLGMPLPAGVIRVYKPDSGGHLQFVGEDRIHHTPRNQPVELYLGSAFDITAKRVQTAWHKRHPVPPYKNAVESAHRIELHNGGDEPVRVTVREPMPGEWKILQENHPHTRPNAATASWELEVPASGKTILEYRVLTRW